MYPYPISHMYTTISGTHIWHIFSVQRYGSGKNQNSIYVYIWHMWSPLVICDIHNWLCVTMLSPLLAIACQSTLYSILTCSLRHSKMIVASHWKCVSWTQLWTEKMCLRDTRYGSPEVSNCSLYWSQPIYHQQTTLQALSEPTQALWWSSIHHYSHWHVSCYSSYWNWKGWEWCPDYQDTSGCQEPFHLSPDSPLSP